MEYVRLGGYGVGFVCRMKPGGCEGTVTVAYGGRVCGTLTVKNPKQDYVGSVVGPNVLEAGETAIYYHDLGPGATYTGTMPGTTFENELGNGVICTMPANAGSGDIPDSYSVAFDGACASHAGITVSVNPYSVLIDCVEFPASSSGTYYSISHPAIAADQYIIDNQSSWTELSGDSPSICGENTQWCISVTKSGDKIAVRAVDTLYSDNSGSVRICIYAT